MERVSGTAFIDHYPQLNSLHMLNHRSFTISRSTVHNMLRATASYSSASLKTWRSSIQCPQLRLPAVQGTDKNYSRKNTYGKTGDGIRVSCIIWLRRYFFATASPPPLPPPLLAHWVTWGKRGMAACGTMERQAYVPPSFFPTSL